MWNDGTPKQPDDGSGSGSAAVGKAQFPDTLRKARRRPSAMSSALPAGHFRMECSTGQLDLGDDSTRKKRSGTNNLWGHP